MDAVGWEKGLPEREGVGVPWGTPELRWETGLDEAWHTDIIRRRVLIICSVSRTRAKAGDAVPKMGDGLSESALQEWASNRPVPLRSKGVVVNDRGKGIGKMSGEYRGDERKQTVR